MNNPIFLRHEAENANHISTLKADREKTVRYHGQVENVLRFITDTQLMDEEMWERFVSPFRTREDDRTSGGWRCEYWGKMMRGAVYVYSMTGDQKLYKVLEKTTRDLLSTADQYGRISSYTVENEFSKWDTWGRKYIMLSLMYFMEICRDEALKEEILKKVTAHADYIAEKFGSEEEGKRPITKNVKHWGGLNSSSILEPVMLLYKLTKKENYLKLAHHIISCGGSAWGNILELSMQDNIYPYQYPVTKAYEMISFFEGVLEYSFVTGEEKYRRAVENFGKRVLESDITVIGCAGMTHELFDHSGARQTSSYYDGIKQETCVTVTWMKFCLRMLMLTGDPKYADCFEQSLYNAYIGALNTKKNINTERFATHKLLEYGAPTPTYLPFDSYSEMRLNIRGRAVGGLQQFKADNTYYGCCACIGAAGVGLVGHMALMKTEGGIAVNLYSDCDMETKTPEGNKLGIAISGGYPRNGVVKLALKLKKKEQFSLSLRIPTWSVQTTLSLNGEALEVTPGYTVIDRVWKSGDEILLSLDMRTELYRPDSWGRDVIRNGKTLIEVREDSNDKNFFALRRGPLMLARDAEIPGNSFDPVEMLVDSDGYAEAELCQPDAVDFETVCTVKVKLANKKSMTLVDFSSAGKTWDEASLYEVWIPLQSITVAKRKVIRVTVWNEFLHEKEMDEVKALYPDGIHAFVRDFLKKNEDMEIRLAALCDPDQGLPNEVLESTDVLIWWGHKAHNQVDDALVERIRNRVYLGKMGFVALHSAHHSKPFRAIVGTNGNLTWGRNQKEIMWTLMPSHEIAAGIPDHFLLECEELYSEPFYIPQPDALVFGAWYEDGHIMRAGACFHRGAGKVFYFQPGHETCSSFYNPYVQRVIENAVRWAAPTHIPYEITNGCPHILKPITDEFE